MFYAICTVESVFAFMDSYGKETLDLQKQLYAIENEKNSFQKRKNEVNNISCYSSCNISLLL